MTLGHRLSVAINRDRFDLERGLVEFSLRVGEKLGGVGPGLSPKTALSLGLKVDAEALPADLAAALKAGKVDLDDPASTVALLKANAAKIPKRLADMRPALRPATDSRPSSGK